MIVWIHAISRKKDEKKRWSLLSLNIFHEIKTLPFATYLLYYIWRNFYELISREKQIFEWIQNSVPFIRWKIAIWRKKNEIEKKLKLNFDANCQYPKKCSIDLTENVGNPDFNKLAKNLTNPLEQYLIKIGRNPEAWFFFEFGQLFDKFYFFDLCFQAQNLQHPIW